MIRRHGVLSVAKPDRRFARAAVALSLKFDLVFQRNFRWDDRALNASFGVLVAHVIAGPAPSRQTARTDRLHLMMTPMAPRCDDGVRGG